MKPNRLAFAALTAVTALAGACSAQPRPGIPIERPGRVNLPDLESGDQADIVPDNIRAVSVLYYAAQLEELKFFAVVDRIVDRFVQGTLPIDQARGELLYQYWKDAPHRLTEKERRALYARVFGTGTAAEAGPVNSSFPGVWIQFLTEATASARMQKPTLEYATAVKLLARNVSLYGNGTTFAATQLRTQMADAVKILSDASVQQAYGVRDMWQLIERVSALELGGALDSVRYRTRAQAGSAILSALADSIGQVQHVAAPPQPIADNAERWLAVAGTEGLERQER